MPVLRVHVAPEVVNDVVVAARAIAPRVRRETSAARFAAIPEHDSACPALGEWLRQNVDVAFATDERRLEAERILVERDDTTDS